MSIHKHSPSYQSNKRKLLPRRAFLRLAAAVAAFGSSLFFSKHAAQAGAAAMQAATTVSGTYSSGKKALTAKRWGMVIDTRKLTDPKRLEAIAAACHTYHNVPAAPPPQDIKWFWTDTAHAAFGEELDERAPSGLLTRSIPLLCNHCDNPACTRVCPTGATFRRDDGLVVMDYHRCIGCRYCMAACPYGSRSFNYQEPQAYLATVNTEYPPRMRGVVEKCSFCMERLAVGKGPLCAEASDGAIVFGDLDDPASPVRSLLNSGLALRRKPSLGTVPCVYYIL